MVNKDEMRNRAMARKIDAGMCMDLSDNKRTETGDYIIPADEFDADIDYCDADKEQWILSIGKNKVTGEIIASISAKFYFDQDDNYTCLWLR